MKPRLYLVDAHAYLHRAYHALPPLTNSRGEPVGVLYGFARTLIQFLRRDKPEGVAVCFDVPGPTFRNKMYKKYKATRQEIDGDLIAQLKQARPLAETLGFKCLEKQGFEADDVMATMARKAVKHGWDAVLVTGEKDALQLVGPGIRVFNVLKNLWMDPPQVEEKFGIAPSSVRDYLAIVGDNSDDVPGVKGVGPVKAVKLIKAYGSLQGAITAAKNGDAALTPKLAQALKDGEKMAALALKLIALDDKVPLDVEPEDCRATAPDPETLGAGLERWEFRALARELGAKSTPVHESIKKQQQLLAAPFADRKPSQVTQARWIYAIPKKGRYHAATGRSGKWLVFVHLDKVDEVWAYIKKATEEGRLGDSAKTSTAQPSIHGNSDEKVICVYTYDWQDKTDVMRIRGELRSLGVTKKIPYKSDEDTMARRYRVAGDANISKYYE